MVSEDTMRLLPDDLANDLRTRFPGLRQRRHFASEASRATLDAAGRTSVFRHN